MQTYTYSVTKAQSTTKTKSESISFGLKQSKTSSSGLGLNLDFLSVDINQKYSLLFDGSAQFSYTESHTYSIEEKEQISVSMPIDSVDQPYNYKLEMRATMYLYYVQVFTFEDERTESKSGIWTNYSFKRVGSYCMFEQFHWNMLQPIKGLNPYRLDVNKGVYTYCGPKDNGVIYV